ncbi:MAG: glycosyltransferase [Acidobacteria bacterium]|nr:glycosyltransferase [Acidobacteriota bacterium]
MTRNSSATKSVLIFANVYPPENIIGAQRPSRFAKYLPRHGWMPVVITGSEQPEADSRIHTVPYRPSLAERLVNRFVIHNDDRMSWYRPAVEVAGKLLEQISFQAIYSTSPPFSVHLAARAIRQRYPVKWVADFRDPMFGNVDRRQYCLKAIDRWLERGFFQDADAVIANTEAMARFWRRQYPQHEGKVHVIYNGFDPETETLRPLPLPSRPYRVMTHAGTIYSVSLGGPTLACFDALLRQRRLDPATFRLRLIGEVQGERELRSLSSFRNLAAAGILECIPRPLPIDEARRAVAESDFLLVIDRYRKGGEIIQVPAKVYDYLPVGRPILAFTGRGSPLDWIVRISGIPHACLYIEDSEQERLDKLESFLRLPSAPSPLSEECLRQFAAPMQTERLAGILDQLQDQPSS